MKYAKFLLVCSIIFSCTQKKEPIPPLPVQEQHQKMIVYQVMTRLFGNKVSVNKTYGSREENGIGKFNDINDEALAGIKELGVTHVWYTGVIEHAIQTDFTSNGIPLDDADVVKGRAGSPYAIKDYYDVNPDLAVNVSSRMYEFEQLVKRTHANGLKVIIDFVPNHVARAYHSDAKPDGVEDLGVKDDTTVMFRTNNNFYYLPGKKFRVPKRNASLNYPNNRDGVFSESPAKVTGNNIFSPSPIITDWYETVKLNYGIDFQNDKQTHFDPIPATWFKMKDILLYWVAKGVDGFRCDMAEMVPVEFWSWVIPQVKEQNPSVVFVAEIYNPSVYTNYLEKGNFDFLYDKVQLYDTLRLLTNGTGSTEYIADIQSSLSSINKHMLHFLENHDEQRIASDKFADDMWKAVPAMTISATIDKGPVMIYFGQEVGEKAEGVEGYQDDDGRTSIYDYWGVPVHQGWMNNGKFDGGGLTLEQKQIRIFYRDLLTLASNNKAIVDGAYADITAHNIEQKNFGNDIHAFVRYHQNDWLLIISGFNVFDSEIRVEIPLALAEMMGLKSGTLYIARDLLWKEVEVGFDDKFGFPLKIKPFSSFIFKIK